MKIAIFGCPHGRHDQLTIPDADILICTGDYTRVDRQSDVTEFLTWFAKQPHAHKILIAGNHNRMAEDNPVLFLRLLKECALPHRITYLQDGGTEIMGLKIWGSPVSPSFCDWAFNRDRGAPIRAHWDLIPDDTQILVTHGPAYGHLDLVPAEYVQNGRDRHQGCHDLREVIDTRLKRLKLHCHSHLHSEGCQTKVVNGVTFVNGAVVGEDYRVRGQIQVVNLS